MEWSIIRDKRLKDLRNCLTENQCSIFTGAGVSVASGLPTWDNLIFHLYEDAVGYSVKKNSTEYKLLQTMISQSAIIAGRYIEEILKKNGKTLKEAVYAVLYEGKTDFHSPLLQSICNLITKCGLTQIITYNYDDILDRALEEVDRNVVRRKSNAPQKKNERNVFHVHGILPVDPRNTSSDAIVLSEKDYHTMYNQTYNWSDVVQIHALRSTTCIFIGLSMNDPNLRRLLEIANSKQRHYAFLKREHINNTEKAEIHREIIEATLQGFNVEVIWYRKYDQLPDLIEKL